ncbi:hypothetical protein U8C35_27200 (plasmid) [Sinorhizobium medicae]|uniref:hypothetical protein n=1 Tax=Sinorhizobium medicae TaxID=110321 RepID=UPI002AF6C216|nr:hypothetical protein [Sinorhizobium medicae]WQO62083.1 hypothetical protein U8C35_27200 [Sinorhizobium medicae]
MYCAFSLAKKGHSHPQLEKIRVAAVYRYGIAYVLNNVVQRHIASGTLEQVLDDWSSKFDGYYLSHRLPASV